MRKIFAAFWLLCPFAGDAQWTKVSSGITGAYVTEMTTLSGNIFAGSYGGVFISRNNGATWSPVNNGLKSLVINSIVSTGGLLYVATNGNGNYVSSNQGDTWTAVTFDPNKTTVKLAVNGAVVYGSSNDGTLYALPVGASSASIVNTGISNPGKVMATSNKLFFVSNGTLYSSSNGTTWSVMNPGQSGSINAAATSGSSIAVSMNNVLLYSIDEGASWYQSNIAATFQTYGYFGGKYLISGYQGSYVSSNGATWTQVSSLPAVSSFVANGPTIFAATTTGTLASDDGGISWTRKVTGMTNAYTQYMASSGNSLYVSNVNRLYRSDNGGTSWVDVNVPIPDGGTINAMAISGSNVVVSSADNGVYISGNGGGAWSASSPLGAPSQPVMNVTMLAKVGADLYGSAVNSLMFSRDDGQVWYPGTVFPAHVSAVLRVPDNIFYGMPNDIHRFQTVTGQSAHPVSGLPSPFAVTSMATLGAQIYCGTLNNGVYGSSNLGDNWTSMNNGLNSFGVRSLMADGERMLVCGSGGIFYNTIKDQKWVSLNDDLPVASLSDNPISSMVLVNDDLYVAVPFSGVYVRCVGQSATIAKSGTNTSPVLTSSAATGNQWYLNGSAIGGATGASYSPTASGKYSVQTTTKCTGPMSTAITIELNTSIVTGDINRVWDEDVAIYPIPTGHSLSIVLDAFDTQEKVSIEIVDIFNHTIRKVEVNGGHDHVEDVSALQPGLHLVKISGNKTNFVGRFIKN